MRLSRFQGNSMTIKYPRRQANEEKLSGIEIKLLKTKGNREKLEKYGVIPTKQERKFREEKRIADEMAFERINNRHKNAEWTSVQERSNDIALSCLGYNKNKKEDG